MYELGFRDMCVKSCASDMCVKSSASEVGRAVQWRRMAFTWHLRRIYISELAHLLQILNSFCLKFKTEKILASK